MNVVVLITAYHLSVHTTPYSYNRSSVTFDPFRFGFEFVPKPPTHSSKRNGVVDFRCQFYPASSGGQIVLFAGISHLNCMTSAASKHSLPHSDPPVGLVVTGVIRSCPVPDTLTFAPTDCRSQPPAACPFTPPVDRVQPGPCRHQLAWCARATCGGRPADGVTGGD